MSKETFICTRTVRCDGETYPAGAEISLTEKQSPDLLAVGAVDTEDGFRMRAGIAMRAAGLALPTPLDPPIKVTPEPDEALIDAIGTLKEADFGQSGVPNLAPLRKAAKRDVTDAERDAAWAVVQTRKGAA